MIALILLCMAGLCLSVPHTSSGPRTAAFILALAALLLVVLRWGGLGVP